MITLCDMEKDQEQTSDTGVTTIKISTGAARTISVLKAWMGYKTIAEFFEKHVEGMLDEMLAELMEEREKKPKKKK